MTGILSAAIASAVVGAGISVVTILLARALPGAFSILYLLPFLTSPLIGGLAGGLVSRSFVGMVGSFAGCAIVPVVLGVVVFQWTLSFNGLAQVAVVGGVLVAAGHLTGVIVRPIRLARTAP